MYHVFFENFWDKGNFALTFPLGAFYDGRLAVDVFFVLSGCALSWSYFNRSSDLDRVHMLVVKRIPRLSIPILGAAIITVVIAASGLTWNQQAGAIIGRDQWLTGWLTHNEGVWNAIRFAFVDVYLVGEESAKHSLIPFLWTIRIELLGSVLVFSLLYLYAASTRWAIVVAAFGLAITAVLGMANHSEPGFMFCFLVGVFMASPTSAGLRAKVSSSQILIPGVTILILAFDGYLQAHMMAGRVKFIIASMLVFMLANNKSLAYLMKSRLSLFLGKISFPLFLIQFPVIVSFTSWLITLLGQDGFTHSECFVISLFSLAVAIFAAWVFSPIDTLGQAVASRFGRMVLATSIKRSLPIT